MKNRSNKRRCPWCVGHDLYVAYHDEEWGVPVHDERRLFEFLILEGAQAGLSWLTILKKRPAYRAAFDDFKPARVARYDASKIEALRVNAGIVRNRLKIDAAVSNARAYLEVQRAFGGFDAYLWDFVDGRTVHNAWTSLGDVPAHTPVADRLSKDLVRRGFRFVGPTICYSLMQAVGLVNDHLVDCYRHRELR